MRFPARPAQAAMSMLAFLVSSIIVLSRAGAEPAKGSIEEESRSASIPAALAGFTGEDVTQTTVTSGSCVLRVSIDHPSISTAQRVTATIEVTAPARFAIEFPEIDAKVGLFAVTSVTNSRSSAISGEEPMLRSTRTVHL